MEEKKEVKTVKTDAMKEANKYNWIRDIIAIVILVSCMFGMVKGFPILLGGAHDATGAPILISYVQAVIAPLLI